MADIHGQWGNAILLIWIKLMDAVKNVPDIYEGKARQWLILGLVHR